MNLPKKRKKSLKSNVSNGHCWISLVPKYDERKKTQEQTTNDHIKKSKYT